jgi:hypothetical protein
LSSIEFVEKAARHSGNDTEFFLRYLGKIYSLFNFKVLEEERAILEKNVLCWRWKRWKS